MELKSILLVDDEPSVLEVLSCSLQDFFPSAKICTALSFNEAMEALQGQIFPLAIIDYLFSGEQNGNNGVVIAQRAKELYGEEIKIILFSGYPLDHLAHLVDLVVQKPVGLTTLEILIRSLMKGEKKYVAEVA